MNGGKYFHDYFNEAARIAGFNVRWKGTEEAFKKTLQKRSPRHISLFKKKIYKNICLGIASQVIKMFQKYDIYFLKFKF